jgi:hypothetical protein
VSEALPFVLPPEEAEHARRLVEAVTEILAATQRIEDLTSDLFFVRQAQRIRAIAHDCLFEMNLVGD